MKLKFLPVILIFLSSFSYAGSQIGEIQYVIVRASDGLIYFRLSGSKSGAPGFATSGEWMIRDESSNVGKQQYAMLLAAQLAGKSVTVSGFNTCVRWGDGEDVNEIRIIN